MSIIGVKLTISAFLRVRPAVLEDVVARRLECHALRIVVGLTVDRMYGLSQVHKTDRYLLKFCTSHEIRCIV